MILEHPRATEAAAASQGPRCGARTTLASRAHVCTRPPHDDDLPDGRPRHVFTQDDAGMVYGLPYSPPPTPSPGSSGLEPSQEAL